MTTILKSALATAALIAASAHAGVPTYRVTPVSDAGFAGHPVNRLAKLLETCPTFANVKSSATLQAVPPVPPKAAHHCAS